MSEKRVHFNNTNNILTNINQSHSINDTIKSPVYEANSESIIESARLPFLSLSEQQALTEEENEQENEEENEETISLKSEYFREDSTYCKYERTILEIIIKLILHITLISIFETLFYFLYVSSLENDGIETTVNTFINDVTNNCKNMSAGQIQIIDDILELYINSSIVIQNGNNMELERMNYNNLILHRAWTYSIIMTVLFIFIILYVGLREINIRWKKIILENILMVLLLAVYELMFFNTIIYKYHPISTEEISRNAVETLQNQCGILKL